MTTTNLWRRFRQLLPDEPLLVGTVASVSSYGATITLVDGGALVARGDATVGQRVFVRNGVIEGLAPVLTIEAIEI